MTWTFWPLRISTWKLFFFSPSAPALSSQPSAWARAGASATQRERGGRGETQVAERGRHGEAFLRFFSSRLISLVTSLARSS
jgi:hypothetical protein